MTNLRWKALKKMTMTLFFVADGAQPLKRCEKKHSQFSEFQVAVPISIDFSGTSPWGLVTCYMPTDRLDIKVLDPLQATLPSISVSWAFSPWI